MYSEICGGTWIKYCTHSHLPSPHHFDTALWELFGEYEDNFELGWRISCAAGKWEHYRPELQSQIGVWRGDHFIKVHMTFIASIKLNQDKSVHSRHINHSNLTLIKTTIWFQPPSSLGLSHRLDKIYIFGPHTPLSVIVVWFFPIWNWRLLMLSSWPWSWTPTSRWPPALLSWVSQLSHL